MPITIGTLQDSVQLLYRSATKISNRPISHGKKKEWKEIDNAAVALLPEVQKLYWNGVERELRDIISTLKAWEQLDPDGVTLEEEKSDEIYGFDTYIDQVSESSREFADLYMREKAAKLNRVGGGEYVPQDVTLQNIVRKFQADAQSRKVKQDIKRGLELLPRERDSISTKAKLLLQSAAWLDIDKVIEHRPPLDGVGFWKRPMPPQLQIDRFCSNSTPVIVPECCVICTEIIRGSMFKCTSQGCKYADEGNICENCQHEGKHSNHPMKKIYKHCILSESIDFAASRKICQCGSVARMDMDGNPRSLFPVENSDYHRVSAKGAVQCGLLTLGELVAEAKYDAIQLKMNRRTIGQDQIQDEARNRKKAEILSKDKTRELIATETINEKDADADIPFFIREITDRYPFGNVHMALQLGPVLIENGVEHTQGGALITSRDPPIYKGDPSADREIEYSIALDVKRQLFSQNRDRQPKRYKTALKQVVGGVFSGHSHAKLEEEIIDLVVQASKLDLSNSGDHIRKREALWKKVLEPIIESLRTLMQNRVDTMLTSVTNKLLDPSVNLKWNKRTNNCQDFCSSILDYQLYGSFLARKSPKTHCTEPLYLLSFVCRPGSYTRERKIQTKFDIPSGLCEEYLLKHRYGLHVDSDIIDSLQEYWYDWGAFGGPLYKYQNLFPWDCTEAYGRSATSCNDCNISKHVWSFPFDSWSIATLHLTRPRILYPEVVSKHDWMRNRLQILLAQDALNKVARVMASSTEFRKATAWMTDHPDLRMDRMKLGGIHRAQPFSHQYEAGQYHEYFIAEWAHLRLQDQIAMYEEIREKRRLLPDVPIATNTDWERGDDSGGGGGDAMFLCFGFAYFGDYYADNWDGTYTESETMTESDAALLGTVDSSANDSGGGDGGDGGGCGGCGGCGGD
ncbi:hypothetical protein B0J11DRAFT_567153 [Dendryphion nanum]|uniref:Uncharacterized protein n=1 Tax=Dendryphion nanum TaxID=256645 RepID=A0A9P9E235_9PLEO|nr:hypothetical protein B0J11DRAFT_567153 [Dendryphion nanum]